MEDKAGGQEIDLLELARKVWAGRRTVLKWCGIAAVAGLVAAFSIPKEYTTTVTLAPESKAGGKALGGLGALAGMAGINTNAAEGGDALSPDLYPDVVASIPFATGLFGVPVRDSEGEVDTDVYGYLSGHLRSPWWSTVISLPFKCLCWVTSLFKDEETGDGGLNTFRLTEKQQGIVKALNERVSVSVDKKTSVITLSVTMQDPLISAVLADTVTRHLQGYITAYRTDKARHDLEFAQKIHGEAKARYHAAQQEYAAWVDANQNISLRSAQTHEERLRNEMNLAYGLYNQTAQQLQLAKAKVQENTPVYTVVQPPTVPLRASRPSKPLILLGAVFLAGVAATGWVLFGRDFAAQLGDGERK